MLAEHEQFAAHHKQLLQEAERTRVGLELALRHETAQHSLQSQEQSKLVVKLQHEMEDVTTSFKTQLHQLQEEHNKVRFLWVGDVSCGGCEEWVWMV